MLTPEEAEEARGDMLAGLSGFFAGLTVIGAAQIMAATLRFIWWLQS